MTHPVRHLPLSDSLPCPNNCGIHAIAIAPSHQYLATSASNPADVAVFSLPDFVPVMIGKGHTDWSFCVDFVNDEVVVSGSRDRGVCAWKIPKSDAAGIEDDTTDSVPFEFPLMSKTEHEGKVRDLRVNRFRNNFSTLGTEGTIRIWDPVRFDVTREIQLVALTELVCMADDGNSSLAVGSQSSVTVVDQRTKKVVLSIPSHDSDWGVRSVTFFHHLITIGGGAGRVSFYDRRMNQPLLQQNHPRPVLLDTGHDQTLPHAVYTHNFDPSGTRMFIGGGPLLNGYQGCYASFWL